MVKGSSSSPPTRTRWSIRRERENRREAGVRLVTLTWLQSGQVSEPSAVDPQQSAGSSRGASALLSPPSAEPPAIPAPPPQSGGREAEREEVIDWVCCMKLLSTSQPFSCMASHSESGAWSRARVVRACSAAAAASKLSSGESIFLQKWKWNPAGNLTRQE